MKVLLFANTGWYLYNFRRSLAEELRREGYDVLLASPPDEYGVKLRSQGYKWIEVPMQRRSVNPLREFILLHWLQKLMRQEQIQLVHSFTLKCAIYGSVAARLAKVPARIIAVAGMGYTFTSTGVKARALRVVVNSLMRIALGGRGLKLVLQNPDDEAIFLKMELVAPRDICMIPGSGVNCENFKPSTDLRHGSAIKVLLPARILWDKGISEYVEAAREVRMKGGGVDFLLAGSPDPGNPTAVPVAQIQEWEKDGLIKWLGHVEEMPALFQEVDVVALPSYREGLPKGLIEAGASGKPLIATDVPGCNHVVKHNVNGLLVPPRDATALAAAVISLRDQPALRARLGAAARATVLDQFDERIVLQRTCALYAELLRPQHVPGHAPTMSQEA